jgi:iron-sulfur cluster repair protein YtfE (RIC family)
MARRNDDPRHPEDAIEMLKMDHQKVRRLFQQYATASDQQDKQEIAEQVFIELEVHTQLEETVFYPAFAELTDKEGKELVAESLEEHQAVKELIEELRDLTPDDAEFEKKFNALRENVEHHAEEEESEMFPKAEIELAEQAADLMEEMQEIKQQLLAS